jgi:hypothetical protein
MPSVGRSGGEEVVVEVQAVRRSGARKSSLRIVVSIVEQLRW